MTFLNVRQIDMINSSATMPQTPRWSPEGCHTQITTVCRGAEERAEAQPGGAAEPLGFE